MLLDYSASYTFISRRVVNKLGLKLIYRRLRTLLIVKVANSEELEIDSYINLLVKIGG